MINLKVLNYKIKAKTPYDVFYKSPLFSQADHYQIIVLLFDPKNIFEWKIQMINEEQNKIHCPLRRHYVSFYL